MHIQRWETNNTGIRFIRSNLAWISLPVFNPEGKELKAMQDTVTKSKDLRSKDFIVFDVRGNSGGSSLWGDEILSNIFGEDYVFGLSNNDQSRKTYAEWRVSEGNIKHLQGIVPWLKEQHGENSEGYKTFAKTLLNIEAAIRNGEPYAKQIDFARVILHF